jgi:hypothetical protein
LRLATGEIQELSIPSIVYAHIGSSHLFRVVRCHHCFHLLTDERCISLFNLKYTKQGHEILMSLIASRVAKISLRSDRLLLPKQSNAKFTSVPRIVWMIQAVQCINNRTKTRLYAITNCKTIIDLSTRNQLSGGMIHYSQSFATNLMRLPSTENLELEEILSIKIACICSLSSVRPHSRSSLVTSFCSFFNFRTPSGFV